MRNPKKSFLPYLSVVKNSIKNVWEEKEIKSLFQLSSIDRANFFGMRWKIAMAASAAMADLGSRGSRQLFGRSIFGLILFRQLIEPSFLF